MATSRTKTTKGIKISIVNKRELSKFREGLIGILHRIEIEECGLQLAENIKSVYDLLTRLVQAEAKLARRRIRTKTP